VLSVRIRCSFMLFRRSQPLSALCIIAVTRNIRLRAFAAQKTTSHRPPSTPPVLNGLPASAQVVEYDDHVGVRVPLLLGSPSHPSVNVAQLGESHPVPLTSAKPRNSPRSIPSARTALS
jgi:hypothetical protein